MVRRRYANVLRALAFNLRRGVPHCHKPTSGQSRQRWRVMIPHRFVNLICRVFSLTSFPIQLRRFQCAPCCSRAFESIPLVLSLPAVHHRLLRSNSHLGPPNANFVCEKNQSSCLFDGVGSNVSTKASRDSRYLPPSCHYFCSYSNYYHSYSRTLLRPLRLLPLIFLSSSSSSASSSLSSPSSPFSLPCVFVSPSALDSYFSSTRSPSRTPSLGLSSCYLSPLSVSRTPTVALFVFLRERFLLRRRRRRDSFHIFPPKMYQTVPSRRSSLPRAYFVRGLVQHHVQPHRRKSTSGWYIPHRFCQGRRFCVVVVVVVACTFILAIDVLGSSPSSFHVVVCSSSSSSSGSALLQHSFLSFFFFTTALLLLLLLLSSSSSSFLFSKGPPAQKRRRWRASQRV